MCYKQKCCERTGEIKKGVTFAQVNDLSLIMTMNKYTNRCIFAQIQERLYSKICLTRNLNLNDIQTIEMMLLCVVMKRFQNISALLNKNIC